MREVYAGHGSYRAMGYKFRCRVVEKIRIPWFFGSKTTSYQYILERYHMSWNDNYWSKWYKFKSEAIDAANLRLDEIEKTPEGEYI